MDTTPQPDTAPAAVTHLEFDQHRKHLKDLASSYAFAAPEVAHIYQAEAAESLNVIARFFGLLGEL